MKRAEISSFFLFIFSGEVKKLKTAQKEHSKLLRNQAQYERQVEKLKSEVLEMKRNKVKLVQKMKETDKRHREMETQRTREMSTLKKIGRKNESKIKSLEAEKRMKELALKRKSEEVSLLRKAQRRVSQMRPNSKKVNSGLDFVFSHPRIPKLESQISIFEFRIQNPKFESIINLYTFCQPIHIFYSYPN